ncbi:MAG TPA: hypothetical protein VIQ31_26715 [Phormidium sp.]
MLQLSFLSEVEPVKLKEKSNQGSQLSLLSTTDMIPIVNRIPAQPQPIKQKQAKEKKKGKYKGKICTILSEYEESLDGMSLKLCKIQMKDGATLSDIPIAHINLS